MTDTLSLIGQLFNSLSPREMEYLKNKIVFNKNIPNEDVKLRELTTFEGVMKRLNFRDEKGYEEIHCPHCGVVDHCVAHGRMYNKLQREWKRRYLCKGCGKTFLLTTKTIFNSAKYPLTTYIKYMFCMLDRFSIRKSARICKISRNASFEWRHRILDIMGNKAIQKLSGIVECDETFLPLSFKGNHKNSRNFTMPRKPHKRGHQIKKNELNDEIVCIPFGVERDTRSYGKVASLGKINFPTLKKFVKPLLEPSGTVLCTDKLSIYERIASEMNMPLLQFDSKTHPSIRGNGELFSIQRVNALHSNFKQFLSPFHGVATKYTDNYIKWFSFMYCKLNNEGGDCFDTMLKEVVDGGDWKYRSRTFKSRSPIPTIGGRKYKQKV